MSLYGSVEPLYDPILPQQWDRCEIKQEMVGETTLIFDNDADAAQWGKFPARKKLRIYTLILLFQKG